MDNSLLLSFEQLEREHWWFVVRRRLVLDVLTSVSPANCERILEVGCGTGGLLGDLRHIYPDAQVNGVEPSDQAASVARRSGCRVDEAVFEELPMDDASSDIVIALDVLEHCADHHRAAAEAHRVLRPGGVFIATVPALPALWGPHDEANDHQRRYVRSTLREPLERAGFAMQRVTYFNTLLLPIGYLGRLMARSTHSTRGTGVEMPARPVNAVLRGVFGMEVPLLRRVDLPIGMSLLCVAHKQAS